MSVPGISMLHAKKWEARGPGDEARGPGDEARGPGDEAKDLKLSIVS